MKTIYGMAFALALFASAFVAPRAARADTTCDSQASYDSSGNGTEPDGSPCSAPNGYTDPDPNGGIGD